MIAPSPHRRTITLHPDNQESPIHFYDQWITPDGLHYLRNHYRYPDYLHTNQSLSVTGDVRKMLTWTPDQLRTLPSKKLLVPLECAGNKRSSLQPRPFGVQWGEGALSQAWWRGVPLRDLLERTGWKEGAVEVVFTGTDGHEEREPFQRSLPLAKALDPDTLVCWEMNGQPIPHKHGGPLRLIVPGWYAMASVKWLCEIRVTTHPFQGTFQTEEYVYYPHSDDDEDKAPVTTININAIIQYPLNCDILQPDDPRLIRGIAWTGEGAVDRVEVSIDGGTHWNPALLQRFPHQPYAWVRWTLPWNPERGRTYGIVCRARDTAGRMQPPTPRWNRKGYGSNGAVSIQIKICD